MRAVVASAALHVAVAFAVPRGGVSKAADAGRPEPEVELYSVEHLTESTPAPTQWTGAPVPSERAVPRVGVSTLHPAAPGPSKLRARDPSARAPATGPEVPSSSEAPARFVLAFGTAAGRGGGGSSDSVGDRDGVDSASRIEPYPEREVRSPARLRSGVPPEYPAAARTEGAEADVPLEIVVNRFGTVVDARVLRHVGYGMDEAALAAVRTYAFAPAQREGRNVPVRMRWLVQFRIE